MNDTPEKQESSPRAPSPRIVAALAAAMLALGVLVGAAIGPAPSPSLAIGRLLPSLIGAAAKSRSATTTSPPAVLAAQPTPSPASEPSTAGAASDESNSGGGGASTTTSAQTETQAPATSRPKTGAKAKPKPLPPVTRVWLIELGDSSFGEAAAQSAAAAYIDTQAVPMGTLLSEWSALDASALASEAALLAEPSPQLLDTIVQPPCPAPSPEGEGAAGAQCAPDTPGAVSAAGEFLKATLPTITSSAAYRENGLIVITFASLAQPTATGLPAGASTATLTDQPPAGALVISPFASAGKRSSLAFDPASPKQSLEKLLRR